MADILSYISSKVENGIKFDTLVGNLLAYKPETWGYTEQDYNSIGADFAVESNSLYNLPIGNYKLINLPDSPFNSEYVNISVFEQDGIKIIICDIGSREKYYVELSSTSSKISWIDISDIDGSGTKLTLFHIGTSAPSDSSMLWIDISSISINGEVLLKYYNNSSSTWIPCTFANGMSQSIYDPQGIRKDPYDTIVESINNLVDGKLAAFLKHRANVDIHISEEERDIYDQLVTKDSVILLFAVDGELYNTLLESAKNKIATELDFTDSQKSVTDSEEKYDSHLDKHIALNQIAEWDAKSPIEHTHELDSRVTINISDISGDFEGWIEVSSGIDYLENICYGNGKFVAIGYESDTIIYSTDGMVWSKVNISDTPRSWASICYGDNKFVAISWDSIFAYSVDGVTWTEVEVANIGRTWRSICYGNGMFVAVGTSTFAYSVNGIEWVEITISLVEYAWVSVCYGNGKFIAISYNNTKFAYSVNGIIWTIADISIVNQYWLSICYGNGKFVVVGESGMSAYSADGINWIEIDISASKRAWRSVCYGNGKFVTVAYESTVFAYSKDGVTWYEDTMSDTTEYWRHICYGNGKYIVTSEEGVFGILGITVFAKNMVPGDAKERIYQISSFDILASLSEVEGQLDTKYHNGNTLYTEDSSGSTVWKKIIDNTKFGTANYNDGLLDFSTTAETSFKNISGTPSTLSEYGITNGVSTEDTKVVEDVSHYIYTPAEYSVENVGTSEVYVGIQKTLSVNGGGTDEYPMSTEHAELDIILASTNPNAKGPSELLYKCNCEAEKCAYIEHWLEGKILDDKRNWQSVCYGNDKFVAVVNSSNVFAYSYDGITWIEGTIGNNSRSWTSICYGNGMFVAVGGIYVAYSYDGIIWTEVPVRSSRGYSSVCYGNDKFVAVGYNTNVAYSYNGITWTESNFTFDIFNWTSICYGSGMFVAIARNSNIFAYSYDGITWTEGTISDTKRYWRSVCYGNDKFVAIASDSNIIVYSYDGINWLGRRVGLNNTTWQSVCYSNDKFIVISANANIFAYSIDCIVWEYDRIGIFDRRWGPICYGNGKCIIIAPYTNVFAQLIDYIGMPQCKATGLSIIPADVPIEKYISSTYEIDEENPNWETVGLGRMVKVDTSTTNTVIEEKYIVNNHEYNVKIKWEPEIGVVFDLGVVEAVETCQSMHDNFSSHMDGVKAAITLYDKLFTDNGWK